MLSTDEKILERASEELLDEFKEHADAWRVLEQKAQIGVTISGVFVGAIFA